MNSLSRNLFTIYIKRYVYVSGRFWPKKYPILEFGQFLTLLRCKLNNVQYYKS